MRLPQKLSRTRIDREVSLPCVTYEPAALKEWPTGWQIEYRVLNPDTLALEKRRIRFEKIRKRLGSDVLARKHARTYCDAITKKLITGWNPYMETRNVKSFHRLTEAMDCFIREKEADLANGVFRADSMRTYRSQVDMLRLWLNKNKLADVRIADFDNRLVSQYLDYVYIQKKLSPRTWNNYVRFLRTLWGWFIEKNYCEANPVSKIKVKPKVEKERVIIPPEWSSRIVSWFRENNPAMELVCGLIYNSFMRPSEICRTQLSDIHLSQNGIRLPASKTKNKHARWCLLPPHLSGMLRRLNLEKLPPEWYLISEGFTPGKKPVCPRNFDKVWNRMRAATRLPDNMQLYSLRDTGITDLKTDGYSNLYISGITGHLNSAEIETYTHNPDVNALRHVLEKSKRL